MSKAQIEKFARVEGALACPLCGAGVRLDGTALRCGGGHAFSVAAKGYANFVPNQRPLKGYDRAFFEARARFFGRGAYRHVLDGLLDVLAALDPAPRAVLDAGCGEGSYARAVAAAPGLGGPTVFALDLAKDALQVASRGGSDVLWMVADVARIPLRGASVDCVLDVFTPANYAEFDRVLTPGGIVCKVVPSGAHLHELRHAARGIVRSEDYANDRVADYFAEHYNVVARVPTSRTVALDEAARADLLAMTPLLFGADPADVARIELPAVTVAAEILVGRRR